MFACRAQAGKALGDLGVGFSAIDMTVAVDAGASWGAYRRRGGARERIVADFLIAAHAAHRADRLLTRDRGFGTAGQPGLEIVDPGA